VVNPRARRFCHNRLCVIGNAETCLTDHGEIIRAIAHGKGFMRCQPMLLAERDQRIELCLPPENGLLHDARQRIILEEKFIGLIDIKADRPGDAGGEEGEAA
jgi:hypothetical protein